MMETRNCFRKNLLHAVVVLGSITQQYKFSSAHRKQKKRKKHELHNSETEIFSVSYLIWCWRVMS